MELKIPLKIFGKGFAGYDVELRVKSQESRNNTVEFLGEVTDEEKVELMGEAKAFIIAAEDEDFGIVPVEAMSVGTPVIAYKSGGLLETVVEGKTGVFFDELTVGSLKQAIKRFEKITLKTEDCVKQAEKFSQEKFREEIVKIVNEIK